MLSTLLSGNCFPDKGEPASRPSPKEQATAIAANSPVEVKFVDGSRQQGWMSEVSDSGFVLTHEKNHQAEKAQIGFAQVETVKQIKEVKPAPTKTRNIFMSVGMVFGAFAILDGILHARGCC